MKYPPLPEIREAPSEPLEKKMIINSDPVVYRNDFFTNMRINERIGGFKDGKKEYTEEELKDYIYSVCIWNYTDPEPFLKSELINY
jgi:hypothetical protein